MPVSIYSRYYRLDTVEDDGKVSLCQRSIPAPEEYPDRLIHTVVGNETPDQLAAYYYGRADLWWRVADANPDMNPLDWKAGDKLVIPPVRVATQTPRK